MKSKPSEEVPAAKVSNPKVARTIELPWMDCKLASESNENRLKSIIPAVLGSESVSPTEPNGVSKILMLENQ
jgi:hypothetical protein